MNSRPMNSYPWSYVISSGLGYIVNHIVSNKFIISIVILYSYCVIWIHPVTESIIVIFIIFKISFYPFLLMTKAPIISSHILFHGISSDSLGGNFHFFAIYRFVCSKLSQFLTSFQTMYVML